MLSANRRIRLNVNFEDDWEIIDVKLKIERKQSSEGDESFEWIEEKEVSPVTVFRMRTTLLVSIFSLVFAGATLFL